MTPAGMIAWVVLHHLCATSQKRRIKKKKHVSRRRCCQVFSACRLQSGVMLFAVLLYTNTQAAAGMEEAIQQFAQQTQANAQQVNNNTVATQQQQQQAQQPATQEATQEIRQLARTAVQVATRTSTAVHSTADSVAGRGRIQCIRPSPAIHEEAAASSARKKGEVELHKLITMPDVFAP